MFVIEKNITDLDIREKNILKLLFSMNVHQVATPEMILEEARSYILFFRETGGKVSAYIALHLTVTNRKLYYVHSSNPFPEGEMETVEQEALEFAEGLGAVLDEKDLSGITMEEKKAWIDAQEIFKPKAAPEPPVQPASSAPAEAAPVQQTLPSAPPIQQAPQAAPALPTVPATPVQQEPPIQPAPPVQPVALPQPPEVAAPMATPQAPEPQVQKLQPQNAPAESRSDVPSAAAAKKRQEILQKAIKEGIAKPPKQSSTPPAPSPSTGVVSRDREALARLLTSF